MTVYQQLMKLPSPLGEMAVSAIKKQGRENELDDFSVSVSSSIMLTFRWNADFDSDFWEAVWSDAIHYQRNNLSFKTGKKLKR